MESHLGIREHGKGESVVLIHGVGMQSLAWAPQIEALAKSHRVIAIDLPGHGASAPLPQGSTLTDYVGWLHEVFQRLKLGAANLVGHSMGAMIATGFAIEYPQQVKRLAVLSAVFCRDAEAKKAVLARAQNIATQGVDIETPLKRWFGESEEESKPKEKTAGWLRAMNPSAYATAYTAFATGDDIYADRLAEIRCPFVAITGSSDPNSTEAMSHAMAEAAHGGESIIIKDHRHMVNLTAPDEVNAHLLAWLKR